MSWIFYSYNCVISSKHETWKIVFDEDLFFKWKLSRFQYDFYFCSTTFIILKIIFTVKRLLFRPSFREIISIWWIHQNPMYKALSTKHAQSVLCFTALLLITESLCFFIYYIMLVIISTTSNWLENKHVFFMLFCNIINYYSQAVQKQTIFANIIEQQF